MTRKMKTFIGVVLAALFVSIVAAVIYFRHDIAHQVTLAGGKRTLASHAAELCDMTDVYTTPASYFDKITRFPAWKQVPRGFQVFDNVPLQIDGMICLWGAGNTKAGIVFPEKIEGLKVGQKFETLYVYHAAFFASPNNTPVYQLVFRYVDGSSATNEILYGADVLDWYGNRGKTVTGPTGPNSKIAWHTDFSNKKIPPLRFCLTAINNPQPNLQVETVDLYSSKNQTAGCIHAITTGRAGLMR